MASIGEDRVDLPSDANHNSQINSSANTLPTSEVSSGETLLLQSASIIDCRVDGMDGVKSDGISIERTFDSQLPASRTCDATLSDVKSARPDEIALSPDTGNDTSASADVVTLQAESSAAPVSAATVTAAADAMGGISKNQLKKLKKLEKLKEKRAEKSKYQKEQRKLRKRKLREERGEEEVGPPTKRQLKKNTMQNSSCKIRVVLDCSFDHLMAERDIKKLVQQVQYCYSSNRRATHPMQLYLTSLGGKTLARLEEIGDYQGWDMYMKERSYEKEFMKDEIVYLTSDSPNVLETLDESKVYIIGGLVDHNHHKGHCFDVAVKQGISHAQLPIGEHIQLSSRKVLTVNHVFEILLRFTETKDWKEAFHLVIPKRKQADEADQEEQQELHKDDQDTEQELRNDQVEKQNQERCEGQGLEQHKEELEVRMLEEGQSSDECTKDQSVCSKSLRQNETERSVKCDEIDVTSEQQCCHDTLGTSATDNGSIVNGVSDRTSNSIADESKTPTDNQSSEHCSRA